MGDATLRNAFQGNLSGMRLTGARESYRFHLFFVHAEF